MTGVQPYEPTFDHDVVRAALAAQLADALHGKVVAEAALHKAVAEVNRLRGQAAAAAPDNGDAGR